MTRIEICSNGLQSALNAEQAGADCIELCTCLEIGGLTPSMGILTQVISQIKIPARVLIRPRGGNYIYSKNDFDTMLSDIECIKKLGYEGVVVGVLNKNNMPDYQQLALMLQTGQGLKFTFHRAIDTCPKPLQAIEQLISLGFDKVLTSGGKPSALEGRLLIAEMQQRFGNNIGIMAGGGINSTNIIELIEETKIAHCHASLSKPVDDFHSELYPNKKDATGADMCWKESNYADIQQFVSLVKNK